MQQLNAWTDYPIAELGDPSGLRAPVRACLVLSYDGNKYCRISVEGVTTEVKAGYLYRRPGRSGEVPTVRYQDILKLQPGYRRPRGKPASLTVSYLVYAPEQAPDTAPTKAKTLRDALKWCRRFGRGAEVLRLIHAENRNGACRIYADTRSFIYA